MNPPSKLSDLMSALDFESTEGEIRFDRQTGQIVRVEESILSAAEEGDEDQLADVPDWQKEEIEIARAIVADVEGKRFIDPPDQSGFHEYRHMERFIGTVSDDKVADQLWRAIKRRGAFRHFKNTLHRLGLRERWFRYRDQALKEYVIEWAQANEVPCEDDVKE